jgi:hypothetical protein
VPSVGDDAVGDDAVGDDSVDDDAVDDDAVDDDAVDAAGAGDLPAAGPVSASSASSRGAMNATLPVCGPAGNGVTAPQDSGNVGPMDEKNEPGEQRRAPRVSLGLLIQVRAANLEEFRSVVCDNLSVGGMFLRTAERRPLGTEFFFQINVAGHGTAIEGLGKVVRITDDGMGIEFVSLLEPSATRVRELVTERLRSGGRGA